MKKIHILSLLILVVLTGVTFVVWSKVSISKSKYFAPVSSEKIQDFKAVPMSVDQVAKIKEQINTIPNYADIEEYQKLLAIAQNYSFLGEGRNAYNTLLKAINLKPEKSVAFNMLGNTLVSMGALQSARVSFEHAVAIEPKLYTNHVALASFLRQYFASKKETIAAVYKNGLEQTENNSNILKDNASWLEEIGDIKGAIALWQKVYEMGGKDKAVLERINALRASL